MSADQKSPKAREISQPLVPATMPAYEFRREDECDAAARDCLTPQPADERKLDLSGVVFNFK